MGKGALENRRVWITGASSGIGRAVAIEFAKRGARVILSGRKVANLDEAVKACGADRAIAVPFDTTDLEAGKKAANEIEDRMGGLDIAFLNAGTCEYVDTKKFDSAIFERQIKVNFLGLVYGVEVALPLLRKSKAPQIVGMSSASIYGGLPTAEAYGASKAAAKYFCESLRIDLMREGVHVGVVCPGFVRTPLTDLNDFSMPFLIDSETAAKRIVRGVERRKYEIHFPKRFTWTMKLLASLPEPLYSKLVERFTRRKEGNESEGLEE